jgi:thiosulfate reductase cytochrome b subunit
MDKGLYLYPAIIRIWHFLNAILIIVLIVSGVSMQYSDPAQPFLRFDVAVTLHNISGIVLTVNYLVFIIGIIISGNAKQYRIRLEGLRERLIKQFRYYTIDIFKGAEAPFPVTKKNKFNPIQQVTYFLIMFIFMPLLYISGLSLLYSGTLIRQLFGTQSFFYTDILHMIIGFLISIFLIIHLYFCTIGTKPLNNFKSIITGYHEGGH